MAGGMDEILLADVEGEDILTCPSSVAVVWCPGREGLVEKQTSRHARPPRRCLKLKARFGSVKAMCPRLTAPLLTTARCSHADRFRASQVVRHGLRNSHWRPSAVRISPRIMSQLASKSCSSATAGVTSNWYAAGDKLTDAPSPETSLTRPGCHIRRMPDAASLRGCPAASVR